MGLLNGAEAYHIDPRFNRGVSVTLAPSVTAIKRNFGKEVFKLSVMGLSIPAGEAFRPLTPNFCNLIRLNSTILSPFSGRSIAKCDYID